MAKPQVDRALQELVVQLRDGGQSYDAIVKQTGLSKSTVRDIVKRGVGESAPVEKKKAEPKVRVPAPARNKEGPKTEESAPIPHPSESAPSESARQSALDELTRERTATELMGYIAIVKEGYIMARKSKQEPDKKVWQEVQYLKLYKDAIRMLIDCTGLTREAVDELPSSPVDAYLTRALETIRENVK